MAATESVPLKARKARVPLAITSALLVYFAARVALEAQSLDTVWRVGAAIAPVPVVGWLIYELIQSSRDLDEMQKRIQLEALATAYSVVFMLLMLLGAAGARYPAQPQ